MDWITRELSIPGIILRVQVAARAPSALPCQPPEELDRGPDPLLLLPHLGPLGLPRGLLLPPVLAALVQTLMAKDDSTAWIQNLEGVHRLILVVEMALRD